MRIEEIGSWVGTEDAETASDDAAAGGLETLEIVMIPGPSASY